MGTGASTIVDDLRGLKVLVIGDVMVDSYLWGHVGRISPEAPVPVVQVTERSARLGGAANVALNVHALGAEPYVLSITGNDPDADRLAGLFHQVGLTSEGLLRSPGRRTTVKTRVISGHQHIVRVDEESEEDLDRQEEDLLLAKARELLGSGGFSVVIFEDYDKGVLTERVIEGVIAAAGAAKVPVAVDPKKRNFFAYKGVQLFKPNMKELREGLKLEIANGDRDALRAAVRQLEDRLGNELSLVTLSEHGVYVHKAAEEHFLPAHHRSIADVSGAGDTVISVAALALASGASPRTIAALANLAGGLVCESVGVVPIDRERLKTEWARTYPEA